eukprot:scpid101773/ scgid17109/ 
MGFMRAFKFLRPFSRLYGSLYSGAAQLCVCDLCRDLYHANHQLHGTCSPGAELSNDSTGVLLHIHKCEVCMYNEDGLSRSPYVDLYQTRVFSTLQHFLLNTTEINYGPSLP